MEPPIGNLTTPENMSVGVKDVNAQYTGISGTIGLLGSEANASFVVLAETNITIDEYPDSLISGEYMIVNGTLLDDLGLSLNILGIPSSAVVHLLIDGNSVASTRPTPHLVNSALAIHCLRTFQQGYIPLQLNSTVVETGLIQ